MTEGLIIYRVTDYQAAIEFGGKAYRERYGKPPRYVALPSCVDVESLNLWTLQIASHKASAGTVQLLGQNGNGYDACRKCGASVIVPEEPVCWECGYDGREDER